MRRVAAFFVLLLLGACTNPIVQADVTRFHTLPAVQQSGRSFTIVPDQTQVGSLEFQDYATQVANALAAQGWRPVAPRGTAETQVSLHWGVGPSETVTWQSPSSVYTGMGYWGSHSHWYGAGAGWYDPFPYWETRSATYYPRWLSVRITEAAPPRAVLFEGRAVAEGTRREITLVMPYLVRALFTGFPGANGSTVRIAVPIPER